MPLFDLDDGIHFTHRSGATLDDAFEILKKTVTTFAKQGYAVSYTAQKKPESFTAAITDKEGTALKAVVVVVDEGTTTQVSLDVSGQVFLGGILGRMVSADTIKSRAEAKLDEMLKENFQGQPKKRAPLHKDAPPPPAKTPPLPPGHPAARPKPASSSSSSLSLASPFQQLVELSGAGGQVSVDDVRTRTAAVAAAHSAVAVDAAVLHQRLVQAARMLARSRGGAHDDDAALSLLARSGASIDGLEGLVAGAPPGPLGPVVTAWAAAAAVVDVIDGALSESGASAEVLQARLDEAFERRRALTLARPPAAWARLDEVTDAFEAQLIDEAERDILREKILAR
ncbi:MAG: hypothetical protein Q8O67_24230 [Deltaproteobacteria bacterium]|nr:hypothetical protein [Deltaproteobacteria bacterium]